MYFSGLEGKEREQGDHSGAEQHFSTSGQSEQTPAVHFRIRAAVTNTLYVTTQIPDSSYLRASTGYF